MKWKKPGSPRACLPVGGALHNQNPNSATPWLGSGSYVLNGTVVANKAHKAEDKPRGLDNEMMHLRGLRGGRSRAGRAIRVRAARERQKNEHSAYRGFEVSGGKWA